MKWHLNNMEILTIQLNNLTQILSLNLLTSRTHSTRGFILGTKNKLVDDDIIALNAILGQLLDETISFVQGKEFRNANTNEGCLGGVGELSLDGANILSPLAEFFSKGGFTNA